MDKLEYIKKNYKDDLVTYLIDYINSDMFDSDVEGLMEQGYDKNFAEEIAIDVEAERFASETDNLYAL